MRQVAEHVDHALRCRMLARTARVLERLRAAPGNLFVALDAARSADVLRLVGRATRESACLFDPPDSIRLADDAPYLVACHADDDWLAELLDAGWGDSWGIFMTSRAKLGYVRAQLQRVIDTSDEAGEPLVFRFYDPRVARVLLPRTTAEQAALLFDEVDVYYLEDADPDRLLCFSRASRRVDQLRVSVA
jgi:hypothetical protein